jgi:hypothetical protein
MINLFVASADPVTSASESLHEIFPGTELANQHKLVRFCADRKGR